MSLLFTVVSGPATTPVSVDDCKLDLRIEDGFILDDELINSYIIAASKLASEIVGKKLINETIKLSLSKFSTEMDLKFLPVYSVEEIQYFDENNDSQTISVSDFYLYNFDQEGCLVAKDTTTLPTTFLRRDAVNITFKAGYGETSENIPVTILKAIRLIVAHWYENRSQSIIGFSVAEIPYGVEVLLGTERTGWVA